MFKLFKITYSNEILKFGKAFMHKINFFIHWKFVIKVHSVNHQFHYNLMMSIYDAILFRIQKHPSITELNFNLLQIPVAAKTERLN